MTENPLIRFSTKETINLIIKLGGVPILAHAYRGPGFSAFSEVQVEELISVLLGYGLEGIEVFHPFHLQDHRIDNLLTVCEEQDLIPTIGSDHHSSQREYNGITDCQLRDSVLNAAQIDFSKILERLGILY